MRRLKNSRANSRDHKTRDQSGAVLVLVLFLLSGLAVLSIEFNRTVLLDHVFSATTRNALVAKPLLASGETIAAIFLVNNNRRTNDAEGNVNPLLLNQSFRLHAASYGNSLLRGSIQMELEDENSRLPLAALFPRYTSEEAAARTVGEILVRLLRNLLLRHGFEGSIEEAAACAEAYVENLLGWCGETSLTTEARLWYIEKTGYYPPLRPLESLDELLLVYWPGVNASLAERVLTGGPAGPGLFDNVSIWTHGPMNVNTLKPDIAAALPQEMTQGANLALALEEARKAQGDFLRAGWQQDVFYSLGLQAPASDVLNGYSRWFRVTMEAGQGAGMLRMQSVGWLTNTYMEWVARTIY